MSVAGTKAHSSTKGASGRWKPMGKYAKISWETSKGYEIFFQQNGKALFWG